MVEVFLNVRTYQKSLNEDNDSPRHHRCQVGITSFGIVGEEVPIHPPNIIGNCQCS